jgi:hypothetical protein
MDELVKALGPAFAAGLAVQRLLQLLDVFLEKIGHKKVIAALVSLVAGAVLAIGAHLRVFQPLGADVATWVDVAVTALIVSAGTEGFNSLFKFLGYAKEAKKTDAAARTEGPDAPSPQALANVQKAVG